MLKKKLALKETITLSLISSFPQQSEKFNMKWSRMGLGSPYGRLQGKELRNTEQSFGGGQRWACLPWRAPSPRPQYTPGPALRTEPGEASKQDTRDVTCLYPHKASAQAS